MLIVTSFVSVIEQQDKLKVLFNIKHDDECVNKNFCKKEHQNLRNTMKLKEASYLHSESVGFMNNLH